jgi:hypothetical protein
MVRTEHDMSDLHSTPTHPTARKEHRCTYCGGPVPAGEKYTQQTGFFDGAPYRNRYHSECYVTCREERAHYGECEFSPHQSPPPPRVQEIINARRVLALYWSE